jgi:glycosyltransferase involved in cell wall biosynthesis
LLTGAAGRARQMNRGADAASGDLLLFLHADTLLPPHVLEKLNVLEAETSCQFGGFHHRFSGRLWQLRLVSWLTNMRCWLSGVFYGDQAMFVRRSLFESLGGFPEQPILEDMVFCEQALKHAQPTFMREYVITDSRKFEQMGVWRSLLRCLLIIFCHQFRLPIRGQAFFSPVR